MTGGHIAKKKLNSVSCQLLPHLFGLIGGLSEQSLPAPAICHSGLIWPSSHPAPSSKEILLSRSSKRCSHCSEGLRKEASFLERSNVDIPRSKRWCNDTSRPDIHQMARAKRRRTSDYSKTKSLVTSDYSMRIASKHRCPGYSYADALQRRGENQGAVAQRHLTLKSHPHWPPRHYTSPLL